MHKFCGSFIHNINRTITGNDPIRKTALRGIQLYSTSISSSVEDSLANYLVNCLGFSYQKAQSASNKVSKYRTVKDFDFDSNAISVVGFLKSYGFDDTHLRKILYSRPQLLCSNVDTLRPKLQFLLDQGFSESDIIGVVSANPRLLVFGVESAFKILRNVMGCDTRVIALLKNYRACYSGTAKCLMANVALVTSYGIPIEFIRKHILFHPTAFMRKPELFKDIQTLMIKNPRCFTSSEATIKKKLDFLMNELRLEPGYLTSHSALFTYSLEKRVMPRHKILLFLKEKGLLEKNPSFYTTIAMIESRFLNMFVVPFKEVHEFYAKLTGCSMKTLMQESSETRSLK